MTAQPTSPERVLAGYDRFTNQALSSLARLAASEALGVPAQEVRVDFSDDDGLLAIALVTPIGAPGLRAVVENPSILAAGSIAGRATQAKGVVQDRVQHYSGVEISRVDVRISGVIDPGKGHR